ncbi:MAG: MipA/OmpV family protein [Helicobacteraceae bacterium]|nr:MipA/OmpV family protein [Helicobacteraceae bacterium]
MKKLLFTLTLLSSLAFSSDKAYVGGGPYSYSNAYEGDSAKTMAVPFILFNNGLVYARWVEFGAYFLGDNSSDLKWGLAACVEPNTYGYKTSDSTTLSGMSDRDNSWSGGVSVNLKYEESYLVLNLMRDMLGNSNGNYARVTAGKHMQVDKWSFDPQLLLMWRDDNFNNYYYGVKTGEATATRTFYEASSGFEYGAQLYVMYDITDNWHTIFNARANLISQEAQDSPIVNKNVTYSGTISLLYSFEY